MSEISGHAIDRAVQIDEMKPLSALLLPVQRHGSGIFRVNRPLLQVSLTETHAVSIFQINGRDNQHHALLENEPSED